MVVVLTTAHRRYRVNSQAFSNDTVATTNGLLLGLLEATADAAREAREELDKHHVNAKSISDDICKNQTKLAEIKNMIAKTNANLRIFSSYEHRNMLATQRPRALRPIMNCLLLMLRKSLGPTLHDLDGNLAAYGSINWEWCTLLLMRYDFTTLLLNFSIGGMNDETMELIDCYMNNISDADLKIDSDSQSQQIFEHSHPASQVRAPAQSSIPAPLANNGGQLLPRLRTTARVDTSFLNGNIHCHFGCRCSSPAVHDFLTQNKHPIEEQTYEAPAKPLSPWQTGQSQCALITHEHPLVVGAAMEHKLQHVRDRLDKNQQKLQVTRMKLMMEVLHSWIKATVFFYQARKELRSNLASLENRLIDGMNEFYDARHLVDQREHDMTMAIAQYETHVNNMQNDTES